MCKVLTSQVFTSTLKLLISRPDDTLTQQDDEQQAFLQVSMLTGIGRDIVIYICVLLNPVFNLTLQFHRNSTEARVRDSRPPYTLAP